MPVAARFGFKLNRVHFSPTRSDLTSRPALLSCVEHRRVENHMQYNSCRPAYVKLDFACETRRLALVDRAALGLGRAFRTHIPNSPRDRAVVFPLVFSRAAAFGGIASA